MNGLAVPFLDLAAVLRPLRPSLLEAAERVLVRGRYVLDHEVAEFERAFAAYCHVEHCVGMGSGFDALELALRALGIGSGKRVGTVANAGGYATAAIRGVGATPVYVDVDPERLLLDVAAAQALVETGEVDCLVVTHLYGHVVDIGQLVPACRKAGVPVIEDCAQAHGANLNGRPVGSLGDIGCFSFYPTKNLGSLGDAGCCTCNDPGLARALRELRNYGWSERYLVTTAGGRNSRLDEIQAAFLNVILREIDVARRQRSSLAEHYHRHLGACPSFRFLRPSRGDALHLAVVRCTRRSALIKHLTGAGIGTAIHYPVPDFQQPGWKSLPAVAVGGLDETRVACDEVLSIPCNVAISPAQRDLVVAALMDFEAQA